MPEEDESLAHYASRLASTITAPNPILLGVSFGGIIMQEVAKQINYKKSSDYIECENAIRTP